MLDEPTSLPPENNQIDLEELWVNQIDEKSKSPNEALKNIKEGIERSKESSRPIEYQDTTQILEKTTNLSKRAEDVGFWKNDLHAISERNITYGKYLSDYCFNFNKKAKSQRRLRRCFFWITMSLLTVIVIGGIIGIGVIFAKGNIGAGEVASVISAIVGMITAFLVLPKIIGDNLFPKKEDDNSEKIFNLVLDNDLELRKFYQQDKIREYEDDMFGDKVDKGNGC